MNKNKKENIERYNPDISFGLTNEQVDSRKQANLVNVSKGVKGKSHIKIIVESYFNFFNIILFVLAGVFLFCQLYFPDGVQAIPFTKYIFLLFVFTNGTISVIAQEISKKKIQKMKLISDPKSVVIRNGEKQTIQSKDVVLDDILVLSSGNQISCDLEVVDGSILVNESMLTGESDNILKKKGDFLYSGSFVVTGNAFAKATAVGEDTYISNLESKIEKIKKKRSKLMVNIYAIIRVMVLSLIPIVIATFIKTWYVGDGVNNWVFTLNIVTKCGVIIVGMIPIGMILLTSMTLAKAILELNKVNTMIQELYAIENLSAVDTLCLDKTGTITTQNFEVSEVIKLNDISDFDNITHTFFASFENLNETAKVLKEYFSTGNVLEVEKVNPFDSKSKTSSVLLKDGRNITLGAPEYIFSDKKSLEIVKEKTDDGYRVLGLKVDNLEVALFLLKDELRKNIKDTLDYFNELNIDLKIISGDNPVTVMHACKDAGIKNYAKYISMENVKLEEIPEICEVYTIFGRTSPDQKQEIIKCLQQKGRTVGYIGDGVNDTQSLRQADCSIALKSGADSTKAVSDVVLLDDDFGHLPTVLQEGRRVVSNIERSMLLFLTKGIFIGLFSLISLFITAGLVIEIEAVYVYELVVVGIAGTCLAFQKNQPRPIESDFIIQVLLKSLVSGLFMTLSALIPIIFSTFADVPNYLELVPIFIVIAGIGILLDICRPFSRYTLTVFISGTAIAAFFFFLAPNVFCNPNYLKGAGSIAKQFQLIGQSIFNLSIYKEMNVLEISMIFIYLVGGYGIYFGLKFLMNLIYKFVLKVKVGKDHY